MEEKAFLQHIKEIDLLQRNLALLEWDEQTGMPEKAAEYRAEMNGVLTNILFDKENGEEMKMFLAYFKEHQEELSEVGLAVYEKAQKEFDLNFLIPKKEYVTYKQVVSKAYTGWIDARNKKDFKVFLPHLKEMVGYLKSFIPLWQKNEKTPYDVLLNRYEPEMTTEKLDQVFAKTLKGITEIRETLREKGIEPETDFLTRFVPREKQEIFVRELSSRLGYRFDEGRLDDTVHPFMTGINRHDARITTKWVENDFKTAIFGVIHEAGHGLYEQNVSKKFDYTNLSGGTSMGIHESQSLFNEIIIGSSRNFWKKQYPYLQEVTGDTFLDIPFEKFYPSLKKTASSLIRLDADPLTYPIHIIIRYEIEKAIFNEDYPLDKLNDLWKEKYEKYLGVTPTNDLTGILQDVHWSGGDFGYFPSYALGYMYAAQLYYSMNKEFNVEEVLLTDDYSPIYNWNKAHIHQYGMSKTPTWLMTNATGEELNPQYLLDYLKKIYYDVYKIK